MLVIAIMQSMISDLIHPSLSTVAREGALLLITAMAIVAADASAARAEQQAGAKLYAVECASCHGAKLEGQSRWWQGNEHGRLPAPPLDASGHAWQHSDAELGDMIANAMVNVAGPDYRTDMPAFAPRLSDAEIRAVLEFIKAQWPEGVRAAQSALNPDGGQALAGMLENDGDWTFPPDCLTPMQRAAAAARGGPPLPGPLRR
ncbi:MAG: c-type cytochrome [Paracraurococcus sp.]